MQMARTKKSSVLIRDLPSQWNPQKEKNTDFFTSSAKHINYEGSTFESMEHHFQILSLHFSILKLPTKCKVGLPSKHFYALLLQQGYVIQSNCLSQKAE